MTQKNTTNPGFWHTESDGERWGRGQIKAAHVGEQPLIELTSLSAPALVFIITQQGPSPSEAHVFINISKSEDEKQ